MRVLIVSDHRLFRDSLAEALRWELSCKVTGSEWVWPESSGCDLSSFDIAVLDLEGAPHECLELIAGSGQDFPEARLIALGGSESPDWEMKCRRAGAWAYYSKESPLSELVHTLATGEMRSSPEANFLCFSELGRISRRRRDLDQSEGLQLMTHREQEVLDLVDKGLSNKLIGERLNISVHTVKNHVHRILEKLDVQRRGEATAEARRRGWLGDRRRS